MVLARKARMSLRSSMILALGLPVPRPALVSMRMIFGGLHARAAGGREHRQEGQAA